MVVATRQGAKVAAILPVGEVVLVPRHVHAAQQSELSRVERLFIDDRLSTFEEVVVVRSVRVLFEVELGSAGYCLVDMEAVRVGDLLVDLMSHGPEDILELI